MERIGEGAQHPNARAIGVVYLLYFPTAILAGILLKGLVISSDAAATANNILTNEASYRAGFAVGLIGNVIYLAVTALFYRLFRPVNRNIALVATIFGLVGCALQIFGGLLQLAPFLILGDGQLSSVFAAPQLQAAALLSLKLYAEIFNISFVLFGFFEVLLGYLIFKSTFLPRIIGLLWVCAGMGWLTYLWPPLAKTLSLYVVLPLGGLAEIALLFWLLVRGVNIVRWQEQAGTGQAGEA